MGKRIDFTGYKERTDEFRASDKNIVTTFPGRQEKGRQSEIIMAGSKEPPIRPIFDFINPKVMAMREDLGDTMDIGREEAKVIMDTAERVFEGLKRKRKGKPTPE